MLDKISRRAWTELVILSHRVRWIAVMYLPVCCVVRPKLIRELCERALIQLR